jgi:hypothetical protein
MKVIFLDNDGVICLSNNWGSRGKKWSKYRSENPESTSILKEAPVNVRLDNFDTKSIKILNEIIEETGSEIVVSSDWKLHATLEELGDYYIEQGICKRPISFTPNLGDFDESSDGLFSWKGWYAKKRILEIERYLKIHPEVESWVAVDDLNMSVEHNQGHGLKNFVLTSRSNEGIKQSGIKEKVINFLTDEPK